MFYSYKCEKCGEVFTESHGMNENPKVKCPLCKGKSKKFYGKNPPSVIWKAKKSTVGGRS